jgi:hypothetical protein
LPVDAYAVPSVTAPTLNLSRPGFAGVGFANLLPLAMPQLVSASRLRG